MRNLDPSDDVLTLRYGFTPHQVHLLGSRARLAAAQRLAPQDPGHGPGDCFSMPERSPLDPEAVTILEPRP